MFLVLHHRNNNAWLKRSCFTQTSGTHRQHLNCNGTRAVSQFSLPFFSKSESQGMQQLFGPSSEPQRTCSKQLIVPYRVPSVDSRLQCSSPLLDYKSLSDHVGCQSLWKRVSGFTVCFPSPGCTISLTRLYSRVCIDPASSSLELLLTCPDLLCSDSFPHDLNSNFDLDLDISSTESSHPPRGKPLTTRPPLYLATRILTIHFPMIVGTPLPPSHRRVYNISSTQPTYNLSFLNYVNTNKNVGQEDSREEKAGRQEPI